MALSHFLFLKLVSSSTTRSVAAMIDEIWAGVQSSPILKGCKDLPPGLAGSKLYKLKSFPTPGYHIWCKDEASNKVRSFKWRGAFEMMFGLFANGKNENWVPLAASAGNHAQGIALAASVFKKPCTIVVPSNIDPVKEAKILELGGEYVTLIKRDGDFAAAAAHAESLLSTERPDGKKYVMVPPYNHPAIITGQATLGVELMNQSTCSGHPDTIFVQVGGGGLAAGVAIAAKKLNPNVKLIGVEIEGTERLNALLERGERIKLARANPIAGGIAVSQLGDITAAILKELLDDYIVVSELEVGEAMEAVNGQQFNIIETSGAVSLAGAIKYTQTHPNSEDDPKKLAVILSGGNIQKQSATDILSRANYAPPSQGQANGGDYPVFTTPEPARMPSRS